MKLGIHSGQQNCSYTDLQKLWKLADQAGYYWVSVWDHFYENPSPDGKGDCFEAVSATSALAAETSNVRVGCLVFSVTFRNPAVIAKAAATIDHISNGRLELGLGAGWYEPEHAAYGIPFPPSSDRLDMLEEAIQIVRSLFTQERTTFSGKHFHVEDALCNPKPVQKTPRIWIGGKGEKRTLRMAAKYADGWNVPYISPAEYRHKIEVLDGWCQKEGRTPTEIERSVNLGFYMGVNSKDAENQRQKFFEAWANRAPEIEGGMVLGTSAQAVETIAAFAEAGAQGVNIALRAPFDWDALQTFTEEVLPVFN